MLSTATAANSPSTYPASAKPTSVKRRVERFLANDRVDPEEVWPQLARSFLAGWGGGPIVLILDETPNHNDLRCMKLTLAYRKRAMPLCSVCYTPGGQPEPMPELIVNLLRRVAACLPEGAEVTLLADRGLAWPQVVDTCVELGWHYVLRLLSQTRVRTPDGRECSVAELAPQPGTCWHGEALVFKKAGWRTAAVAACWLPRLRRAVAAGQRPRRRPAAVPALRQADLDRGAVPGREVLRVPLGREPRG